MYEEEKIVDIKDMLYRTCRRWRSICVAGLVLLICLLLIKFPVLIHFAETSKRSEFIKIMIQYGGLGFVIGMVSLILIYMVSYVFSNKIYLPEELCRGCGINLIGEIPKNEKKRKNPLDTLIKKIFSIKISSEMQETLAERAAEEISILAAIRGMEWPDAPVIALVSSYSTEIISEFEMQIAKKLKKDVRLVNAGNILLDARSIRMVDRADFIVLVEKQGASVFKEYRETCKKLFLWKKDVLGVILLDVV